MALRPFPTTVERKRELHAAILREGGGPLMQEVSKWRALFPGSRLTYVHVGNLEIGEKPGTGEVFDENHEAMKLAMSDRRKSAPTSEEVVAKFVAKKQHDAAKRKKRCQLMR